MFVLTVCTSGEGAGETARKRSLAEPSLIAYAISSFHILAQVYISLPLFQMTVGQQWLF